MPSDTLPSELYLHVGVLRENDPTPGRVVLWVQGRREGRCQHWRRISSTMPITFLEGEGLVATPVTITAFRQELGGGMGRFFSRFRSGRDQHGQYLLPTGESAELTGTPRSDALLVWTPDPAAQVEESLLAELWPQQEQREVLGANLFLIQGVTVQPGASITLRRAAQAPPPSAWAAAGDLSAAMDLNFLPPAAGPEAAPPAAVSEPPPAEVTPATPEPAPVPEAAAEPPAPVPETPRGGDLVFQSQLPQLAPQAVPPAVIDFQAQLYSLNQQPAAAPAADFQDNLDQVNRGWSAADSYRTEFSRLTQRVEQFHAAGQYPQALQPATEAMELARSVVGEHHLEFALAAHNLAEIYRRIGDFGRAEPLARQAVDVRKLLLGPHHLATAASLNNLAGLCYQMGDLEAAVPLFRETAEALRGTVGEQHPHYASTLHNLAEVYLAQDNLAQAGQLYRQALDIRRAVRGPQHAEYHASLGRLAWVHRQLGNYPQAEALYRELVELRRSALGEGHPSYATTLHELAQVCRAGGNYETAETALQRAWEIRRQVLGEDHLETVALLDGLAGLYAEQGDYLAALNVYRQVLNGRRKAHGESHVEVARCLLDLGKTYQALGNQASASARFELALPMLRETLGEKDPAVAECLHHLGEVCQARGDDTEAEAHLRAALAIRAELARAQPAEEEPALATLRQLTALYLAAGNFEAAANVGQQVCEAWRESRGEDDPLYAGALGNLADVRLAAGKPSAAGPLLQQAAEAFRQSCGDNHPRFAAALGHLASVYLGVGNYARAEQLSRRALEIQQAVLGDRHPTVAGTLNQLAAVCDALGRYAEAEQLLRQAVAAWRGAVGDSHPVLVHTLTHLAALCRVTDRIPEALNLLREAATIDDRLLGPAFAFAAESGRLAYLEALRGNLDRLLTLLLERGTEEQSEFGRVLDLLLRRKALAAEVLPAGRDAVLARRYPDHKPALEELRYLRRQLARKVQNGPGPEKQAGHERLLARWTARLDELETELSRHVPELALRRRLRNADRAAVAAALPAESVLVEFIRLQAADLHAAAARAAETAARYLAFLLPAAPHPTLSPGGRGQGEGVRLIDLGEAEPLEQLLAEFRDSILGGRLAGPEATDPGKALRAALFDPLVESLPDGTPLVLAPDGDLVRLPFEVLPLADNRRVLDVWPISYVVTGRDLLRGGVTAGGQPSPCVVVADPDFNLGETPIAAEEQQSGDEGSPLALGEEPTLRRSHELEQSPLFFGRLAGTRLEGERLAAVLETQPWLGDAALASRLRELRSPPVLHLATHAFFLPDQERVAAPLFGAALLAGAGGPVRESPLLRSGLALAGANGKARQFTPPAEAEDGLLTAEDVIGLDLIDTELVVLSATDTGPGDGRGGEDVLGLEHAFVQAGARRLVLSLWKVPELAAAVLLERFHENVRKGGLDCRAALREAQRYTRDVTVGRLRASWLSAEALAKAGKGNEPFRQYLQKLARQADVYLPFRHVRYWGGFVCVGDPGRQR
jgi:tetratricopeptide (TPR) repeat protein